MLATLLQDKRARVIGALADELSIDTEATANATNDRLGGKAFSSDPNYMNSMA
jgi:hypothetical protein